MVKRNKLYFPKSKIITNLYTPGKEWMLKDTGEEYIGFYHKYTDGLTLTEAVYGTKSKKLVPYVDKTIQPLTPIYDKLKDKRTKTVITPRLSYNIPAIEDYGKGFFKRYFIYRKNYNDYLDFFEVDIEQWKSWKSDKPNTIDNNLYNSFIIDWKLTGPVHDIVIDGQIKTFGVYDTNRRLVFLNDKLCSLTSKILTDYTEFTVHSLLTPENIRKQFGN